MDQFGLMFAASPVALDCALAVAVFNYDENSVSAGSKSDEHVYGSRYYPARAAAGAAGTVS